MTKPYFIDLTYYHATTGQLIGHTTSVKNRLELKQVLDRWEIQPERVESFYVDDKPFNLQEILNEMD